MDNDVKDILDLDREPSSGSLHFLKEAIMGQKVLLLTNVSRNKKKKKKLSHHTLSGAQKIQENGTDDEASDRDEQRGLRTIVQRQ